MSRTNAPPRPHCYRKPLRPALSQHPRTTTALIQTPAIIFGFIMIFMLVLGLIVLWRRGRDDLDAWGSSSPGSCAAIPNPLETHSATTRTSARGNAEQPKPPSTHSGCYFWAAMKLMVLEYVWDQSR
jgi:hypothetical protein